MPVVMMVAMRGIRLGQGRVRLRRDRRIYDQLDNSNDKIGKNQMTSYGYLVFPYVFLWL